MFDTRSSHSKTSLTLQSGPITEMVLDSDHIGGLLDYHKDFRTINFTYRHKDGEEKKLDYFICEKLQKHNMLTKIYDYLRYVEVADCQCSLASRKRKVVIIEWVAEEGKYLLTETVERTLKMLKRNNSLVEIRRVVGLRAHAL